MLRWFGTALLILSAWGGAGAAWAQQDFVDLEYERKATYLIYFGIYVQWPADAVPAAGDRFVIGILGGDPFGRHLRRFEGKPLGDKRIVIHRFNSIDDYRPCHLLFISGRPAPQQRAETPRDRLRDALEHVGDDPVLIVGESEGLARQGAMIEFVADVRDRLIKMEIDLAAARKAGLEISSRLLNLKGIVTVLEEDG